MEMNRYPLSWPVGWKRTKDYARKGARFAKDKRSLSVYDGLQRVLDALDKLGVNHNDVVISTNLQTRLDGLPRSGQPEPSDCGVAVYWVTRNQPMRCMAIDCYDKVADNLAAIAATLEAMRAIDRHGGAVILDRAFAGFQALPDPNAKREWWEVLGVSRNASKDEIREAFRKLSMLNHPDRGGTAERMAEINAAREQARNQS